jgi:hypothetical protein
MKVIRTIPSRTVPFGSLAAGAVFGYAANADKAYMKIADVSCCGDRKNMVYLNTGALYFLEDFREVFPFPDATVLVDG